MGKFRKIIISKPLIDQYDYAIINAVSKTIFKPAIKNGRPVSSWETLPINVDFQE